MNVGDRVRVNLQSDAVKKAFPFYDRDVVEHWQGREGVVREFKYIDDNPMKLGERLIVFDNGAKRWFLPMELELL